MPYVYQEPQSIETLDQLLRHVKEELRKISQDFERTSGLQFQVLHVAPAKPREGLLVVADGTDWDPGSGAGMYLYIGAVWTKL